MVGPRGGPRLRVALAVAVVTAVVWTALVIAGSSAAM